MIRIPLIIGTLPVTLANGTTADATQVMSDLNWIVNQVNANAASLTNTALTNANNNFSVVQSGQAATQSANFPIAGQVQNQVFNTLTSTLGTNTITSRIAALALGAYAQGQIFTFIPSQTNTGAVTMNVDSVGPVPVLSNTLPLSGGELRQNAETQIGHDGVNFTLLAASIGQVQRGGDNTLSSILGSNAITGRVSTLPLQSYQSGQIFTFIPNQQNSGPASINIDTLGSSIIFSCGSTLTGGEMRALVPAQLERDASKFNLLNPSFGRQTMFTTLLGADVGLTNAGTFFDGPSVFPGTSGIWLCFGQVTVRDNNGAATFNVRLWDGVAITSATGASCSSTAAAVNQPITIAISGIVRNPAAGNIRISVADVTSNSGTILSNQSGDVHDSTLTVIRIG